MIRGMWGLREMMILWPCAVLWVPGRSGGAGAGGESGAGFLYHSAGTGDGGGDFTLINSSSPSSNSLLMLFCISIYSSEYTSRPH